MDLRMMVVVVCRGQPICGWLLCEDEVYGLKVELVSGRGRSGRPSSSNRGGEAKGLLRRQYYARV